MVGGRAAAAAEYPRGLCEAIVRVLIQQKLLDSRAESTVGQIQAVKELKPEQLRQLKKDLEEDEYHEKVGTPVKHGIQEDVVGEWAKWAMDHAGEFDADDDVTGAKLGAKEVAKARKLEIEFFKKLQVYGKIRRSSLPRGARVIAVRWVDVDKGDGDYRSRLVAKQFRDGRGAAEWFAATPPRKP